MKAVLLCPAEDYPEAFDWAYENQAEALEAAGFEVVGRRWTDDTPEADADLGLPLVAWGHHQAHRAVARPKPGDYRVEPHVGGTETLGEAPREALDLAHRALAAAPALATYARVDMIADEVSAWQIMELELIEPALWLPRAPGSTERFATAIRAKAEQILAHR